MFNASEIMNNGTHNTSNDPYGFELIIRLGYLNLIRINICLNKNKYKAKLYTNINVNSKLN